MCVCVNMCVYVVCLYIYFIFYARITNWKKTHPSSIQLKLVVDPTTKLDGMYLCIYLRTHIYDTYMHIYIIYSCTGSIWKEARAFISYNCCFTWCYKSLLWFYIGVYLLKSAEPLCLLGPRYYMSCFYTNAYGTVFPLTKGFCE